MQDICLRNIIYKVEKRFSDTPLLIFHGRSKIKKIFDAHDLQVDFPVLFLIHLRNHQRKQVSRYTDEHLLVTGSNYQIQLSTAEPDTLHACIQYNLWMDIPLPKSWDKALSVKKGLGSLDVVSTSVP